MLPSITKTQSIYSTQYSFLGDEVFACTAKGRVNSDSFFGVFEISEFTRLMVGFNDWNVFPIDLEKDDSPIPNVTNLLDA